MSFPRYQKYKPSGVAWLGDVPENWTLRRLGYHFDERREKVSDREFPALSVTKNGVVPQLDTAAKTDDCDNRKRVRTGDFVINSRSDRKGSAGVAATDGSVSLICTVLCPCSEVLPAFVHHLLRSPRFQEEFYRNGKGIVADLWSTNYGEMRNILLALPSLPEQRSIAAFLDRETAKIDALIAEQERLIELLQEKRLAVISHAVTKGLDPSAPMKPSGVEWLGEVLAHWRVGKCGRFVELLAGFAFPSNEFSDEPSAPRLLRGVNIAPNRIRWDEVVRWKRLPGDGLERFELREGDLVVGMDRPIVSEGVRVARVCAQDLPALLLQRVTRLRGGGLLELDYLERLLSSDAFAAHFAPETTGVSVPHISPEQIRAFVIPLPPLSEQRSIVAFLRHETGRIDRLIDEAKTAIPLLHERRSALISAAVIGQIDVRNAVAVEAA